MWSQRLCTVASFRICGWSVSKVLSRTARFFSFHTYGRCAWKNTGKQNFLQQVCNTNTVRQFISFFTRWHCVHISLNPVESSVSSLLYDPWMFLFVTNSWQTWKDLSQLLLLLLLISARFIPSWSTWTELQLDISIQSLVFVDFICSWWSRDAFRSENCTRPWCDFFVPLPVLDGHFLSMGEHVRKIQNDWHDVFFVWNGGPFSCRFLLRPFRSWWCFPSPCQAELRRLTIEVGYNHPV